MPFLNSLGKLIFTFGLEKLIGLFSRMVAKYQKRQADKAIIKASMKALNEAKTGDEIEKAANDALDRL